jgi:cobalt-zinc-cadmium efflux system membrane fusion protein
MRILLTAFLLAAGVFVGAAVPAVSVFVQSALTSAGLPQLLFNFGVTPDAKTPAASAVKVTDGPAGHDRGDENRAGGQTELAQSKGEAEKGHVKMTAEQVATQNITVGRVTGGTIYRHILVPGTITPDTDRVARVPARVVSTVAELRKRLGDIVEKGEGVAVLDSREVADAKSEYLTASVKADLEKTNLDRQQALWDKRISSEQTFLQAKATYSEASLRQDLARQKLSALGLNAAEVAKRAKQDEETPNASTLREYELRAPISGRVVERKVDVGTAVGKEGDPADLYTVADLSTVWIELAVPTVDLAGVKEGARVSVTRRQGDDDGKRAEGKVIFVSPLLNLETRSARVVVALPNMELAWRPGTFVTAEVQIADDVVTARIPKQALQTVEGKRVVFLRTEEGFEKRKVETGKSDDEAVEIVSGLEPGDDIAVSNTFLLKAELGKNEAEHDH